MKKTTAHLTGDSSKIQGLKRKKVIVPISLGQKYHENEQLKASFEAYRGIESITISLCDTLQAYNKFVYLSKAENINTIKKECVADGDLFLTRNKKIINSNENTLQRWDFWIKKETYGKHKNWVENLHTNDSEFKTVIDKEIGRRIRTYVSTCKSKGMNIDVDFAKKQFKDYLIEECAVFMQWAEEKFEVVIYPSVLNKPMQYLKLHYIEDGILEPIKINFVEETIKSTIHVGEEYSTPLFQPFKKNILGMTSQIAFSPIQTIMIMQISNQEKIALLNALQVKIIFCKKQIEMNKEPSQASLNITI